MAEERYLQPPPTLQSKGSDDTFQSKAGDSINSADTLQHAIPNGITQNIPEGIPEKDTTEAEQTSDAPPPPPDGGREAWTCVLGGFCCLMTSYGFISSMGVFQTYYERERLSQYSASSISWIMSVQVFILSALAPIIGLMFDNYGCALLLRAGTFFHVFGLMMVSLSDEYYQIFLSQSICSAIGLAIIFHAATNAVSTWFSKRRGLAIGLASSGAGVGGIIIPIMFNRLVDDIGFGWTMRAIAFLILGVQVVAICTVRSRLKHQPRTLDIMALLSSFMEADFALLAVACFFTQWGILIPFNYISLASEAGGMSRMLSGYLISITNGASIIGRIFPLWIGDHLGRFNLTILCCFLGAAVVLGLWIPASTTSSHGPAAVLNIVFAALFGVPLGCFAAAIPALVGQISPDVRRIGARQGALFFANGFAGLTGNPIAGALVTAGAAGGERYTHLKIFCGTTIAVGAVFFVAARVSFGGWGIARRC